MDFQVGNVVKLRSGGPIMTISDNNKSTTDMNGRVLETGQVECIWFEGSKLKRQIFAPDVLIFTQ